MKFSRHYRTGLILLLAGFVGISLYLYQNFDAILQHQIRQSLREFGVENYELKGARLNQRRFKAKRVKLRGNYENFGYEATATSLEVRYDWRGLLIGKLQSVTLSELDVTIQQVTPSSDTKNTPNPPSLNIENLLPQKLTS